MSGVLVGDVFKCAPEDLTSAQLLVLLALAEDARTGDRIARYSGSKALASKTRLKVGTVHNALSELTARGLISRQHDGHRGRVQHYKITDLLAHHRAALRVVNDSPDSEPFEDGKAHG